MAETNETERERFEAWWDNPIASESMLKGMAWEGWQARAALDMGALQEGAILQMRERIASVRENHRRRMNAAADRAEMAASIGDMKEVSINSTESERHREAFVALNVAIDIVDQVEFPAAAPQPPASAGAGKVEPVAVSVKPLVWENNLRCAAIVSKCEVGQYEIALNTLGGPSCCLFSHEVSFVSEGDVDHLKAAAQADYEQRIRSALVIEPAPDARKVAEEMREACASAVRAWITRPDDCEALSCMDPETGARECALETRGRDCICDAQAEAAEEIESRIRSLPLPGDKVGGVVSMEKLTTRQRDALYELSNIEGRISGATPVCDIWCDSVLLRSFRSRDRQGPKRRGRGASPTPAIPLSQEEKTDD